VATRTTPLSGPAQHAAAAVALLAIVCVACGSGPETRGERSDTVAAPVAPAGAPREVLALPRHPGSVRFAAIGDAGRGHRPQHEVARTMEAFREAFDFKFVVMLGDNVYDGGSPEDYLLKFERPYKSFLDEGVRFYAVLGNHDDPRQPSYAPFNMGGKRYYTFEPAVPLLGGIAGTRVRFFMLDTEDLDRAQLAWLDEQLERSDATWEIPVFHRPIYTSGRYGTPARLFRRLLEPVFVRHGVRVALSGHEHFYERTHPQRGVTYFVSGAAGSLRANDIRPTPVTARGFDTDYSFLLFEVAGDRLFYQAIARTGHSVDAGVITAGRDRSP
jgi:hypothetical protein